MLRSCLPLEKNPFDYCVKPNNASLRYFAKFAAQVLLGMAFLSCTFVNLPAATFRESEWMLMHDKKKSGSSPSAVAFSSYSNSFYVGAGNIYEWQWLGDIDRRTEIRFGGTVTGLAIDPGTNNLFISSAIKGSISRSTYNPRKQTHEKAKVWVRRFDPGDDDPAGVAIVPDDFSGNLKSLIEPGQGINTDFENKINNSTNDQIFSWSPDEPTDEPSLIYDKDMTTDLWSVAVNQSRIVFADEGCFRNRCGEDDIGGILELVNQGSNDLTLKWRTRLARPKAIAFDPFNDDLLIGTHAGSILRFDFNGQGKTTTLVEGLEPIAHNGLAFSDDGLRLLATSDVSGRIWELYRGEPAARSRLTGDFDNDGALTTRDIGQLTWAVNNKGSDLEFDVSSDRKIDNVDRQWWVHKLAKTFYGDANLDGEFNTGDLVDIFEVGEYEDGISMNSGWADGDWNGDGEFNTGDLVFAFQDGGFENGRRTVAIAVPEPRGILFFALALGFGMSLLRRRPSMRRSSNSESSCH